MCEPAGALTVGAAGTDGAAFASLKKSTRKSDLRLTESGSGPPANDSGANVTSRLLTSSPAAWLTARPPSVMVTTVLLVRVACQPMPPGRLRTAMRRADTTSAAKMSLASVAVMLPLTAPLLAAVSTKPPAQVSGRGAIVAPVPGGDQPLVPPGLVARTCTW